MAKALEEDNEKPSMYFFEPQKDTRTLMCRCPTTVQRRLSRGSLSNHCRRLFADGSWTTSLMSSGLCLVQSAVQNSRDTRTLQGNEEELLALSQKRTKQFPKDNQQWRGDGSSSMWKDLPKGSQVMVMVDISTTVVTNICITWLLPWGDFWISF